MTTTLGQPFDPSPFAMTAARSWADTPGRSGRWPCRACWRRTPAEPWPPARSRSSACSSTAARARWTCSTPSRRWRSITVSRIRASWRSTSTSRRAPARVAVPVPAAWRVRDGAERAGAAHGSVADELTLIRSMSTDSVDHETALRLIHTGKILAGRPAWGSWVVYGLGTENRNLPAYVVLPDPGGLPVDGIRNWSSGWLPAVYQGTPFRSGDAPSAPRDAARRDARRPRRPARPARRAEPHHLSRHPGEPSWRRGSPTSRSPPRCRRPCPRCSTCRGIGGDPAIYGLDNPATREYGTRCLLARRLVERGVRFVQLFLSSQPWDTHGNNAGRSIALRRTDRPARPWSDLRQRGLLDETIVLWTGEFGRLPVSQGTDGRDHNRHGFSLWLAGGGFKRGTPMGPPTSSATRRSRKSSRSMTSRPRCSTPWGSTTASSAIPTKGGSTASPTPRSPRPRSCRSCWRERGWERRGDGRGRGGGGGGGEGKGGGGGGRGGGGRSKLNGRKHRGGGEGEGGGEEGEEGGRSGWRRGGGERGGSN